MAIARTPTLLSLDRYAEILGIDPRHFNQMICAAYPVDGECSDVWFQYAWQNGERASREDLARAIAEAEDLLAKYLRFAPGPRWEANEWKEFPKHVFRTGGMIDSAMLSLRQLRFKTVNSNWGRILKPGRKTWTLLDEDRTITYSDPYGEGFDTRATITASYDATDHPDLSSCEIRLVPEGTPSDELDFRQIRGLKVTFPAAGSLSIVGGSEKFLEQGLWEDAPDGKAIDGDVGTNFLDEVDVYRLWTSTEGVANAPILLGWENFGSCLPTGTAASEYETAYAVMMLVNPRQGIVAPIPAVWGSSNAWVRTTICSEPERVRLWYLAGYPCDEVGEMSAPFDRAVAALATARLKRPICGCGRAETIAAHWAEIPDNPPIEQMSCPFGPENGAYEAYLIARQHRLLRGSSM